MLLALLTTLLTRLLTLRTKAVAWITRFRGIPASCACACACACASREDSAAMRNSAITSNHKASLRNQWRKQERKQGERGQGAASDKVRFTTRRERSRGAGVPPTGPSGEGSHAGNSAPVFALVAAAGESEHKGEQGYGSERTR